MVTTNTTSRKLTKDERAKIVELARTEPPHTVEQIKEILKIDNGQQIVGIISFARRMGMLSRGVSLAAPKVPPPSSLAPSSPVEDGGAAAPKAIAPPAIFPEAAAPAPAAAAPYRPEPSPVLVSHRFLPLTPGAPSGFQPQGVPQASPQGTSVGFIPSGTEEKILIYRLQPAHGYVGKLTPPFDITKLAEQYGNGIYRIARYIPGRPVPLVMDDQPVTGHGEPRWPNPLEGAPTMMVPPAPGSSAIEKILDKAADNIINPKPPVASPGSSAVERILDRAAENLINPPKAEPSKSTSAIDEFWMNFARMREQERKDEAVRRDADEKLKAADHDRRMAEIDKKHDQEMSRIKADSDEREKRLATEHQRHMDELKREQDLRDKLAGEHQLKMQELIDDKIKLANKVATEAQAKLTEALQDNAAQISETVTKLQKDFDEKQKHADELLTQKYQLLDKQHEFNLKIIDLEKARASNQDKDLIHLGEKVINTISDRTKEAIEAGKARAMLENPKVMTDAMNNPAIVAAAARSAAAASSAAAGSSTGEPDRVDQILSSPQFKAFLEEWILYVEDDVPYQLMFDSISRKLKREDELACEFSDFVAGRRWSKAKSLLWPRLSETQKKTLEKPYAEIFYEQVRAKLSIIRSKSVDVWESWAKEEQAVTAANAAAATPVPAPAPAPAPETPAVSGGQPT